MFVSVYIPCPFSDAVLHTVLHKISPFCPAKLLIMGDFNATLSSALGRPPPSKTTSGDLGVWAQAADLTEVWHWKSPSIKAYACFSMPKKTAYHIDLAFANPSLLADVQGVEYLPTSLSDHCPLILTVRSWDSPNVSL